MTDFASAITQAQEISESLRSSCVACGTCTMRCNLLEDEGWNLRELSTISLQVLEGVTDLESFRSALDEQPSFYRFIRLCEECNRCTIHCMQDLNMSDLWQVWRQLVRLSGHIEDEEVAMVKVDHTWHTFSVFRELNNIRYDDLPRVHIDTVDQARFAHEKAGEQAGGQIAGQAGAQVAGLAVEQVESHAVVQSAAQTLPQGTTLFFPGCSLVSYAPELTRAAFAWLDEHAGPALLSEQCCAWPLECLGELERTVRWRERLVAAAHQQGVQRIVTVCPGCERQLAAAAAVVAPNMEFVSLARLLVEAGVRINPDAIADCKLPLTVVDSCNDRAGTHGPYVRQLLENCDCRPYPCNGEDAWCCGAGGNVASYDEQVPRQRTHRSFTFCEQAGANTLVTACPTCAYSYAFERWLLAQGRVDASSVAPPTFVPHSINFLELVFDMRIDWPANFEALGDMWQGEHAAWVAEQLS